MQGKKKADCKKHQTDSAACRCLTGPCCALTGFSVKQQQSVPGTLSVNIEAVMQRMNAERPIGFSYAFWHPPKLL